MVKRSRLGSRRQSSAQRHKVEKKIREHKRDVRKAAKVMKSTGHKVRSKKSREEAKLALRVSNSNPDKEKILRALITKREKTKEVKSDRRKKVRDELKDDDEEGSDAEDKPLRGQGRAAEVPRSEMLTSKQVQQKDKADVRAKQVAANRAKQAEDLRQHLMIPPGEHVGNQRLQLEKVATTLRDAAPVVAVIVDARCPVQTVPWDFVDTVVADAVTQREAKAPAPAPSAKKGKRSREEPQPELKPERGLLFVLAKADLVPLDLLANGLANLAEAVSARYAAHATGANPTVVCTALPHSTEVAHTAQQILRTLRKLQSDFFPVTAKGEEVGHNMRGKLGCAVVGLPQVGKTSFCRVVQAAGTEATVAIVPCRSVRRQGGEHPQIVIPGAKGVTFVTVADNERLKREAPVCADIIFASWSRVEKMAEPETLALLIVEKFADRLELSRTFSLPLADTPVGFLLRLGRCILREGGFQPSVAFFGGAGQISSSALTASAAQGAAYANAGRLHRVHRKRTDGRNALRIGARAFLHAFVEARHVPWAVVRSDLHEGSSDDVSFMDVFCCVGPPKQLEDTVAGKGGAGVVLTLQHVMKDHAVLLPGRALELDPTAVTAPELVEEAQPVVEEEGEEEEEEEEEEEGEEEGEEEEMEEGSVDLDEEFEDEDEDEDEEEDEE